MKSKNWGQQVGLGQPYCDPYIFFWQGWEKDRFRDIAQRQADDPQLGASSPKPIPHNVGFHFRFWFSLGDPISRH